MFFPNDIESEYNYLLAHNPDIPEINHPLVNISDALKAYFILAHYFTDESSEVTERMLVGVRDINLLASALGRQVISFGGRRKYTDPIDISATLFFGMVKNHSFNDGNKRTALLLLLYQLDMYGYIVVAHKKDFEKLVVSVAANRVPTDYKHIFQKYNKKKGIEINDALIKTISQVIRGLVKKKDHSFHISPTMKEFCEALEKQNVMCENNGGKFCFKRTVDRGWFRKREEYYSFIQFSGWTRCVGPDTVRKTLQNLNLYEQFATYKDFFEGKERMYSLVDDFCEPLRRLKDK